MVLPMSMASIFPITGGVLQGPLTVEGDINNTTGYVNDVEIYNLSTTYSANVNQSVTTTCKPDLQ